MFFAELRQIYIRKTVKRHSTSCTYLCEHIAPVFRALYIHLVLIAERLGLMPSFDISAVFLLSLFLRITCFWLHNVWTPRSAWLRQIVPIGTRLLLRENKYAPDARSHGVEHRRLAQSVKNVAGIGAFNANVLFPCIVCCSWMKRSFSCRVSM